MDFERTFLRKKDKKKLSDNLKCIHEHISNGFCLYSCEKGCKKIRHFNQIEFLTKKFYEKLINRENTYIIQQIICTCWMKGMEW